jgi:Fic-DOC domain mobile mystery protein B
MMFEYPEGATPVNDISGLKPNWVRTQEDLNLVEAESIATATNKYLSRQVGVPKKWFTVSFLKKIHCDMFDDVWDWAGSFRKVQTIPGVLPYKIRADLEKLCSEVMFWGSESVELTLVEQAARIHHQLVFIHPFSNGNGRFSRLVADRFLKAWKRPIPRWPADLGNGGKHRKEYISALKNADKGELEPLISYMEKYGAMDPTVNELLGNSFFKQFYTDTRLSFLLKALQRRRYNMNDKEKILK